MENQPHTWDVTPTQAIQIQKELRQQVQCLPYREQYRWVGGADISFNRFSNKVSAGIVVLDAENWEVVAFSGIRTEAKFPYVPGLLSFREIPALLQAWEALPLKPDWMMMDGQGIAHPRRLGLASHFGLVADIPALGCAKSRFIGTYDDPGMEKGAKTAMMDKDEQIGWVLRSKDKVKPLFVSPGHKMDLESSARLVLSAVNGYRIPEPTRQAHLWVNELRTWKRPEGVWVKD